VIDLIKDYELDSKQIKYNSYKLAWFMRGSLSYTDVMYYISAEDKEILSKIIEENIETTSKTRIAFV